MTGNRHNEVQVERGEAADRGEGGGGHGVQTHVPLAIHTYGIYIQYREVGEVEGRENTLLQI